MQSTVLEGTWEEIASHADEFAGHHVRLTIIDDDRPISVQEAVTAWLNRSPEEIAEAKARVLAMTPPPRELPPGKTLEDVIFGQWPGNESDEQIMAALKELS
jgi:hypothetical protein